MGNTNTKPAEIDTDGRRSQLFAVILNCNQEKTATSESESKSDFSFMKSGPITRRMAIFGQDYQKSKVEKENAVKIDFVYQIPKSKVIVDPYYCEPESELVTIERNIHGKDNERVFRRISQEIFKPLNSTRKRGSKTEAKPQESSTK